MKELYFTPDKIVDKAKEMLTSLEEFTRKHSYSFTPERSALLLLDLQAYFLDPSSHAFVLSAPAIVPGINALIRAYSRRSLPIILTRHINTPQDAGLMAVWWRELISPDHPLCAIDPSLEFQNGMLINKSTYDAFLDTPLEEHLKGMNIRQLVICGVMTHLCCETTARSAFMRGFEVFFTVDGTATYNEAFHRAALLNLAHGFAHPVLVKDILVSLETDDN